MMTQEELLKERAREARLYEHVSLSASFMARVLRDIDRLIAAEWKPTHQHYKGGLYRVVRRGFIEANWVPAVFYESDEGTLIVRPALEFDGDVYWEGKVRRRFRPLEDKR